MPQELDNLKELYHNLEMEGNRLMDDDTFWTYIDLLPEHMGLMNLLIDARGAIDHIERMAALGYQLKPVPSGCLEVGFCPVCDEEAYLYRFIKGDAEIEHCPHCTPKKS